jgi:LacI family transcriptional regulator
LSGEREAKRRSGIPLRRRGKPPTINDVAELAQVSVGTVSNVLNNRASVSKSKRDRVQKAIEALGFSSSMLAKGMRAQSNALVGLCVPHTSFANLAALADTLDDRSVDANFELIQVFSRYDPVRELSRIRRLIAYRAAGLIIVPSLDPKPVLDHVYAAKLPTVIINRQVSDERRFDQVTIDHEKGIFEVCRQLLAWGHRHIALAVQFPTLSVTRQRLEGLRLAIETGGPGARYSLIEGGQDETAFPEIFADAMRGADAPSAVIASNSTLTSWILQAMRSLGIRCPQDVSLFSLEEPEWSVLVEPQISCIQQPTREIGRIAWDLLMNRINGSTDEPVLIRCDGRINFRDSVAKG